MQNIKNTIESFENIHIMVVGDVMVDSYLWGRTDRISPEAPVPVVTGTRKENRLGGAANVALNLVAMGAKPILCSVIGDDYNANVFMSLLEESKLNSQGIIKTNDRPTTVKTRIISQHQQLLRIDEETDVEISTDSEQLLIAKVKLLMSELKIQALIFQDYDKGVLTPRLINAITELAANNKIPILVDPKRRNFSNYKGVSLFKPNFKEFCEGTKTTISNGDFESIFKAAQQFMNQQNIECLMVTLSEKGVLIADRNSYHRIPAMIRDIADVSGAGDTVISIAGLCLAIGLNKVEIATLSNLAGGLVCEKVGVVPIDKKRFIEESLLLQNI